MQYEGLTEKQKRFIDYYIKIGNATDAAIEAGYSKKTAKQIGSENLSKLNFFIKERLAEAANNRIADATEVLEFLTKVMRGDEKDAFGLDGSLKDRNKAAELLGKRYTLFTDRVEEAGKKEVKVVFAIPRPVKEDDADGRNSG